MSTSPAPAPRAIKQIESSAIHRICSGQVVLDLASCVKELIENALDAGATSVEIRLKDHGCEQVEVSDNGVGIARDSFEAATRKYATSKLERFEDLETLRTFGFRGEALSSMCGVSGEFSVTTRTANDATATKVVYDAEGRVVSESTTPRSVGTTVTVKRLFEPLPVRRKEFLRNAKREYGKALALVQAYALMSKSVRLLCTHQSGKYARANVLHTRGGEDATVRENIVTVFGSKMVSCVREYDTTIDVGAGCRVVGFISEARAGCGRAGSDRQFYYVNGRPVDLPRAARVVNETYRSFNPNQAPIVVLDFQLETDAYDVNVTPDKRKVMLHDEEALLTKLREKLQETFAPTRYTYAVALTPASDRKTVPMLNNVAEDAGDDDDENDGDGPWTPEPYEAEETFESILLTAKRAPEPARGSKRNVSSREDETQKDLQSYGFTREVTAVAIGNGWTMETAAPSTVNEVEAPAERVEREEPLPDVTMNDATPSPAVTVEREDIKRPRVEGSEDAGERPQVGHADVTFDHVTATMEESREFDAAEESVKVETISFSMDAMLARRHNSRKKKASTSTNKKFESSHISKSGDVEAEAAAVNELERIFNKADFAKMRIVGQFNLGFILCTLGDDLFIVDQHAGDEIYNFERLQRTATLSKQPLIHPVPLDLTASEEQTVLQNMPVFLKNGFGFCDVAESIPGADMNNSSMDPTARCGALRLSAVPVLSNVVFDKFDVHELVAMLDRGQHSLRSNTQLSIGLTRHERPSDADASPRVLRPAKTRAALASRACRSSIMIGDALDVRMMRRVLDNLSRLDAPWNCPHGRPVIRHLRALA